METKICSKCKKKYPANLTYFVVGSKTKNGITLPCRFCRRKKDKVFSRKYREEHTEWKKMDNKRNQSLVNKLVKIYRLKYPERYKACNIFNNAIRSGKIKRKPCIICKKEKTDGHHIDYSKPLEVIWLCHNHHKKLHANIISISKGR